MAKTEFADGVYVLPHSERPYMNFHYTGDPGRPRVYSKPRLKMRKPHYLDRYLTCSCGKTAWSLYVEGANAFHPYEEFHDELVLDPGWMYYSTAMWSQKKLRRIKRNNGYWESKGWFCGNMECTGRPQPLGVSHSEWLLWFHKAVLWCWHKQNNMRKKGTLAYGNGRFD